MHINTLKITGKVIPLKKVRPLADRLFLRGKIETSPFERVLRAMILLFVLALLPLSGMAQPPGNTGPQLEQYLSEAARNNPELRAGFHEYLAALQQVPQVDVLPDPELAFGYFINPIETRIGPQNARFGLTQMFPWFGTLDARGDAAARMAKAKFEKFQEMRNRLFYKIKERWYKLYETEVSIRIVRENITILDTFESLATRRYEGAQVSQVDVLRVQIEKEDLQTRLELLKDSRRVLQQELREQLNRSEEDRLPTGPADTLKAETLEMSQAGLLETVMNRNPVLSGLHYEAESARSRKDAARKEGLPTFGLGVDYIITGNRTDMTLTGNGQDALMARAGIQIPLYRKKYRAKEQQAELALRSVRDQQTAVENRLMTRIERSLKDYHDASRRIQLYEEKQIQRTRQAIDILIQEYSTATTDFEELLRMQRKLLDYRLAREKAIVDQNTAIAYIEYLYGRYNTTPEEIAY